MHVLHVVGARPNFMKAAPVVAALARREIRQTIIHTGQHYDVSMSDVFFDQLGMPQPTANLGVGSGSHAVQTAEVMKRFEPVVSRAKPDLVLVYGDVNSTAAAALVCAKLLIPVGHVEAGLRSFDRAMPEEVNRVIADHLSEWLFTPSADGDENLLREGVATTKIHRTGNVMIDTLVRLLPEAAGRMPWADAPRSPFVLVTLHRPSNVDDPDTLAGLMAVLQDLSRDAEVIFPMHPRTRDRVRLPVESNGRRLRFIEPLGYIDFLGLMARATVVVTDSGGIQEETTFLGVPCLTVRENTERPVTVSKGTNTIVGRNPDRLLTEARRALNGNAKRGAVPDLWDGHASERLADVLVNSAC